MKYVIDTEKQKPRLKSPVPKFSDDQFLNAKRLSYETGNARLDSALHLASLGCPVFPVHTIAVRNGVRVCTCRNWQTCDKQGKHPRTRYGLKEATTDESAIRKWWSKHPNSNVGLLTGREVGLFVLDIDVKYGGEFSLSYLQELYHDALGESDSMLPETLTAYTGSGGRHIFFKYPEDILISGSAGEIGAGLDIRADLNYAVVAPSNHLSGNTYRWHGVDTPILEAPEWLIYEIIQASENESPNPVVSSNRLNRASKIKDGEGRYSYLWRYVCGLVNSYTKEEVLARTLRMNEEVFEPPKSVKEIEYQVNYIFRKYGTPVFTKG